MGGFFALLPLLLALITYVNYLHTYVKKEDIFDDLKRINKNLHFNLLMVTIFLLIVGLTVSVLSLNKSQSFSTFFSFASGWQLALANILLGLLVSLSMPVYLFWKWNGQKKVDFDYSKIREFVSSLKDGEMILLSKIVDKAKSLGLILLPMNLKLMVSVCVWIFALTAVGFLNVVIALRLARGYSWGPKPLMVQEDKNKSDFGMKPNLISTSPSNKYALQIGFRSGVPDPLELVTKGTRVELKYNEKPIVLPAKNRILFTNKNVVWNNDESVIAFTYFTDVETTPRSPGYLAIFSTSGNLIKTVDLGNASYYGNNIERPFYPIVSPNGKYIAVATDLIRQISVFDFMGKKIKDLPTKYSKVELFSPEMYELEGGKYSPFLEYKWSEDGKSILYRFEGTEKYYEARF